MTGGQPHKRLKIYVNTSLTANTTGFNLDGQFIVYGASSERECRHVGAHEGFGENGRIHREDVTYGVILSRTICQELCCIALYCAVLCCVVFTHSTADLHGSRHCGHADQPRTGLLDAEAGGRLSQMQSCGLWSPKDGQQPRSPCRNSPRLIYDSLPHIIPGNITALGNVLLFGLF